MNNHSLLRTAQACLVTFLCLVAGDTLATPTFGTWLDTYCAGQPTQATAPQQSRPYRASGSSCLLCHTSVNATRNNLNILGSASLSCNGTTCGSTVNPYCVAHAPSGVSITAPPSGTTAAQGASLTFSGATTTNPDGFPLSYTWSFTGGMPSATGQSVSVPMTVAGMITATLQVANSVGMLAAPAPTRTVTVTTATQAVLMATPASLAFSAQAGGGAPAAQNLSVTSSATQIGLTVSAATVSGNWLAVTPASGTTPATFSVSVNPAGLAAGTYNGTVTISGAAANSPLTVAVTLAVTSGSQGPVASIITPAINVSVLPGGRVTFRGSATDPAGLPVTYRWTFQGGQPSRSTRQNPGAVTFRNPGVYTVTLVVANRRGVESLPATRVVTVAQPNVLPRVSEECRENEEHGEHADREDREGRDVGDSRSRDESAEQVDDD